MNKSTGLKWTFPKLNITSKNHTKNQQRGPRYKIIHFLNAYKKTFPERWGLNGNVKMFIYHKFCKNFFFFYIPKKSTVQQSSHKTISDI